MSKFLNTGSLNISPTGLPEQPKVSFFISPQSPQRPTREAQVLSRMPPLQSVLDLFPEPQAKEALKTIDFFTQRFYAAIKDAMDERRSKLMMNFEYTYPTITIEPKTCENWDKILNVESDRYLTAAQDEAILKYFGDTTRNTLALIAHGIQKRLNSQGPTRYDVINLKWGTTGNPPQHTISLQFAAKRHDSLRQ